MRSSVLLPQPDEPSSAKISPLGDVQADLVHRPEIPELLHHGFDPQEGAVLQCLGHVRVSL